MKSEIPFLAYREKNRSIDAMSFYGESSTRWKVLIG